MDNNSTQQTQEEEVKKTKKFSLTRALILLVVVFLIVFIFIRVGLLPNYFNAWSTNLGYIIPDDNCAREGEQFSIISGGEYPDHCCFGLKEWVFGKYMQAIGNKCYTGNAFGFTGFGICINCGNGICDKNENVCNCSKDCKNGQNSYYTSVEKFCEFYLQDRENLRRICQKSSKQFMPLECQLCDWN